MGRANRRGASGAELRGGAATKNFRVVSGDKIYGDHGGYNEESEDFQNLQEMYNGKFYRLEDHWAEVLDRGGVIAAGSGRAGIMLEPALEGDYGKRARFYDGSAHRSLRPNQAVVAFLESSNADELRDLLEGAEEYARSAGKSELLLQGDPISHPAQVQELLQQGYRVRDLLDDDRRSGCSRVLFAKDLYEASPSGSSQGLRPIGKKSSWKQGDFHRFNDDRLGDADPNEPVSYTLRTSEEAAEWQGENALTPTSHLQFFKEALDQGRSLEAVEIGQEPGGKLPVTTWSFSAAGTRTESFSDAVRLEGTMYEASLPDPIIWSGHEDLQSLQYEAIEKASKLERAREDAFRSPKAIDLSPLLEDAQTSWDRYVRELSLRMPHLPLEQEEIDRISKGLEDTEGYFASFRKSL